MNPDRTVSSDSRSSSDPALINQMEETDSDETSASIRARFEQNMERSTNRDSLREHGLEYVECMRATSLWFHEFQPNEDSEDEKQNSDGNSIPQQELSHELSYDQYQQQTSLNDILVTESEEEDDGSSFKAVETY